MSDPEWRLLQTLPDLPTASSLAEVLTRAGIRVRLASDAGVLGQAAPSRLYVAADQYLQARGFVQPERLLEEDLPP
ncbi:MAG: hypothetical protein JO341_09065 [Gammaproteobacteria bacterium]|nr:hypothetical protein [Gammaproteobacteria bacterium]MBV9621158.1 hypothetical protein [Gammaproteobacteria bacterium]